MSGAAGAGGGLGGRAWVFHAGALGDHVMIWPFVRGLARSGAAVTVVAAPSHAALCERVVGPCGAGGGSVRGVSAERPEFVRLWAGPEGVAADEDTRRATAVVTFVASPEDAAGARWFAAARAAFPGAREVIAVGRPDRDAAVRAALWARVGAGTLGGVDARLNPAGPVVLYVGAGGAAKRWGGERWAELARALRASAALGRPPVLLLSGANEIEAGEPADGSLGGVGPDPGVTCAACATPLQLAARLGRARAVVGADTGPTHLAAQLGVPTLALFGPTDPAVWGPVGPLARVLRSPGGTMEGIGVDAVADALRGLVAWAEGGAEAGPGGRTLGP